MELNEISVDSPQKVNTTHDFFSNAKILNREGPQMVHELFSNAKILKGEGPQVSHNLNMTSLQMLEEDSRACPLCSQEVRLYFINFNEKIEMCENMSCDYPFGYEPVKIIREENGVQIIETKSMSSRARSVGCSQASSQSWTDVDNMCKVFEGDEVPNVDLSHLKLTTEKKQGDQKKAELLANVEKIKQITRSMSNTKKESKNIIKNEKWIKNLQYLQDLSGLNLLKPAEIRKIKKKSTPKPPELKIDIDKSNLASIKIEVNNMMPTNREIKLH